MAVIIFIALPRASTLCMFHFNGILVGEIEWFFGGGPCVCGVHSGAKEIPHYVFRREEIVYISSSVHLF